jgi:hypothetical protein|tara:strand:+ start:212 stop:427 length:216 start_codon:yes stop_codon:yes gene_type:complete
MQSIIKASELKVGDTFIYGNEQVKIEKILEPREWLAPGIVYFHYETDEYWGCVDGQIDKDRTLSLIERESE